MLFANGLTAGDAARKRDLLTGGLFNKADGGLLL
jgi:hypothetical protein